MAKLREGRGGSTLKILYVFRSLLPLSWQSGLFLKQHKWKSSKLSASFSHRPQNNLRDHFFLYTYCSTPIVLPWRFSFKYFRAIYWSLVNYELFTHSWYQSRDFPKVTEPDSCARCWLFLNIYKRENLSSFFSTCIPLHHFMALVLPHWQATCFAHYLPVQHFLHRSNLHKLPHSTIVEAEKVSLEYSKAQIQGEK